MENHQKGANDMITDALINILIAPIMYLFQNITLPSVENIAFSADTFDTLKNIVITTGYFFPVRQAIAILIIFEALDHFNILWALILRIKSFIPFLGGK